MIGIIVLLSIFVLLMGIAWKLPKWIWGRDYECDLDDRIVPLLTAFVAWLAIVVLAGMPVIKITGGLLPKYSEGERIGYLTKASVKGVLWKTNEVQIQVGTGEQAALQRPQPLSIPDADLFHEARSHLGDKCRVHYREWLLMPYWVGSSGYDVYKIDWLPEGST